MPVLCTLISNYFIVNMCNLIYSVTKKSNPSQTFVAHLTPLTPTEYVKVPMAIAADMCLCCLKYKVFIMQSHTCRMTPRAL